MGKEARLSVRRIRSSVVPDLVDSAHRWFDMLRDAAVSVVSGSLMVRLPCHRKIIGCSAERLQLFCNKTWIPESSRVISGCGRCKHYAK